MIKLCVFDLDGTIVNTIADLAAALNSALASQGYPTLSEAEVKAIVGYSTEYMFQHAVPAGHADDWKPVGEFYRSYYERHCCDLSRPYDGVLRSVNRLKAAGIKLAVVSNKPHRDTLTVVNRLFPRDCFNMVLGRMSKFATKPAPEALQFVLDYFQAGPQDAVYVGDSEVDIQFAKNAGVPCISVCWGYRSRAELIENGAARILDDPEEIASAVLEL